MTELTSDEALALIEDCMGPLEVARSDGRTVCAKLGTQDDNPHPSGTDLFVHWRDGFASEHANVWHHSDANDEGYFHALGSNAPDKSTNPFIPESRNGVSWDKGFDQGLRERLDQVGTWTMETDYGNLAVGVDPTIQKTTEEAAQATYKALCAMCEVMGMNPAKELFIKNPAEASEHSNGRINSWWVCWESGPFEWAVHASLEMPTSPWGYCETNWGCDLIFEAGVTR